MIATFRFDWGTSLTPEQLVTLRGLVRETVPDDVKAVVHHHYTGDLSSVIAAFPGYRILIMEEVPATFAETVLDRLAKIEQKQQAATPAFNERCQVVVPDLGLLAIRHVQVLEDCCTNDLQSHLDRGWRVLAVCPQPNQRRPDYILGAATLL